MFPCFFVCFLSCRLFLFLFDGTRYNTVLLIHDGNYMVCHKKQSIIRLHRTNSKVCSHSSKLQFTQGHKSSILLHRRPSIPISRFPSLAAASCVYLPTCRLCVQMAAGTNDCSCRYCVVSPYAMGNPKLALASISVLIVKFRSGRVRLTLVSKAALCHCDF